jgi:hypothetical protein
MKAFRKPVMFALALIALTAMYAGCADETTAPLVNNDEAPLLAPSNVRAVYVDGDVRISWNASAQLNVRGYNVYRLDRENSNIARLTPSDISTTSFTDGFADYASEYEYRVTSVSTKNAESNYAAVVICTPPAPSDRKGRQPGTQE